VYQDGAQVLVAVTEVVLEVMALITMKDPEIEDKLLPRRKATTKKRGADA